MKLTHVLESTFADSILGDLYRTERDDFPNVACTLLDLVENGYTKSDISNEAKFKNTVMKATLGYIKDREEVDGWVQDVVQSLDKLGYKWPEIDMLRKALKTS